MLIGTGIMGKLILNFKSDASLNAYFIPVIR